MNHTKAPFRYDIVGSFLRPAALMKMREAYAAGNAAAEELRQAEDAAIRDLVAKEKVCAPLRTVSSVGVTGISISSQHSAAWRRSARRIGPSRSRVRSRRRQP